MPGTVRDARPDDAAVIQRVARESWHAAYDDVIGAETVDRTIDRWYALGSLAGDITDAAGRADATFLVCERSEPGDETDPERPDPDADGSKRRDSAIIGFAHAGPHPTLDETAKLSRLYAHPGIWGEGVGSHLLDALEDDLREYYASLWLEVLADNDVGVSFYERSGFERIGAQESVLGDDSVREHLYEKGL